MATLRQVFQWISSHMVNMAMKVCDHCNHLVAFRKDPKCAMVVGLVIRTFAWHARDQGSVARLSKIHHKSLAHLCKVCRDITLTLHCRLFMVAGTRFIT